MIELHFNFSQKTRLNLMWGNNDFDFFTQSVERRKEYFHVTLPHTSEHNDQLIIFKYPGYLNVLCLLPYGGYSVKSGVTSNCYSVNIDAFK